MSRFTTIVALIGEDARDIVQEVAKGASNVTPVLLGDADAEGASTITLAMRQAERGRNVYTLIDFDPMAPVVDAWVARLGGETHDLDVAVGTIGSFDLPEYVLVADDIEDARVHWYHGHLRSYAPRRVLATKRDPAAVHQRLSRLASDRTFPTADTIAWASLDYSPTEISQAAKKRYEQPGLHPPGG